MAGLQAGMWHSMRARQEMIDVRVRSTRIQSNTELTTTPSSHTLRDGRQSSGMEPSAAHANEVGDRSMLRFSTSVATNHRRQPCQWARNARYTIISR
jgi:hypothetical protein